jgi:hypothetical protein
MSVDAGPRCYCSWQPRARNGGGRGLFGVANQETAIRWLIALMVHCCNPLAIPLTAAASSLRCREAAGRWLTAQRTRGGSMLPWPIRQLRCFRLTHIPPSMPGLHVAAGQDHEHVGPTPGNRGNREHAPDVAFTTAPRPLPHKIAGLDAFPERFPFHAAAIPSTRQ